MVSGLLVKLVVLQEALFLRSLTSSCRVVRRDEQSARAVEQPLSMTSYL